MTDLELMKLSLSALMWIDKDERVFSQRQAITVLTERLSQAEPVPTLWLAVAQDGRVKYTTDSQRAEHWKQSGSYRLVRDYYTTAPRNTWHSLTDQEVHYILDDVLEGGSLVDVCRAIEKALEEKNK